MTYKITTRKTDPMRVLLSERHHLHPDGEVFIKSDGETYEVGDTAKVRNLMALQDDEGNDLVHRGTKSFDGDGQLAGDNAVVSSTVIPQAPADEPGPTAGTPTTEGGHNGVGEEPKPTTTQNDGDGKKSGSKK